MSGTDELTSRAGKVDWGLLRRELMGMPKETLVELVNVWLKTFWSLQNYWMVFTEAESGFATAGKLDAKVWEKVAPIQAHRVKRTLGLGDDVQAIKAIYVFEMSRTFRTLLQSIVSPVLSTSLYFVVFGTAIGSRIQEVDGISYGAFIVPGLIMLSVLTQSVSNASFGIYFPRFIGTIYEVLSAPLSFIEIVIGYVGAAATKSLAIGLIILATAGLFVPLEIDHPVWMVGFLLLKVDDVIGPGEAPPEDVDLWGLWERITCPVLVLRGAESDLLPAEVAQEMTRRGPAATLVEFPDCGHAPALMDDDQITVVRDWLLSGA